MKALNIRNLPDDLHSRFKAACALDNVNMQDKVVELIREYIEKREKKSKE
jgi:plasmid stability protein